MKLSETKAFAPFYQPHQFDTEESTRCNGKPINGVVLGVVGTIITLVLCALL